MHEKCFLLNWFPMGMWGFAAGILFAELRSIGRLSLIRVSAHFTDYRFKHSLYGLRFKALFRVKHSFTTVVPFGYFFHISGFSIFLVFFFFLTWPLMESENHLWLHYLLVIHRQGRPVGVSGIPVYPKKIRQNTLNSSKYTQNYTQVYFIPEIQRKWYTEYPYLSCNIPYTQFKKPL